MHFFTSEMLTGILAGLFTVLCTVLGRNNFLQRRKRDSQINQFKLIYAPIYFSILRLRASEFEKEQTKDFILQVQSVFENHTYLVPAVILLKFSQIRIDTCSDDYGPFTEFSKLITDQYRQLQDWLDLGSLYESPRRKINNLVNEQGARTLICVFVVFFTLLFSGKDPFSDEYFYKFLNAELIVVLTCGFFFICDLINLLSKQRKLLREKTHSSQNP